MLVIPRRREGQWTGAQWTGRVSSPEQATAYAWGAPLETATPSTVAFTVTGSDVFPTTGPMALFHARHGLVGGHYARAWWAATIGGVLTVVDYGHGGSWADPRQYVAALTGATRIHVDLGSSSVTPEELAEATVLALTGAGLEATAEATENPARWRLTIGDATGLVIPPPVDTTNTNLRGMLGNQRADWGGGGAGQAVNSGGGTGGTGNVHIGQRGTAGRVIGVYLWTRTDGVETEGRLMASAGPAYSLTPGAMTPLLQGEQSIEGFGVVWGEAAAYEATTELWAQYRSDTAGDAGIIFRLIGETPEGNGDLPLDEELLWDVTAPASAATAFGESYTPTVDAVFPIYVCVGLLFEEPDAEGNYPASGRWILRIGDHNDDPNHGTQFDAGPALLTGETTHHPIEWPSWTQLRIVSLTRTITAIGPDEDCRAALYRWFDRDHPSTTPAALVADLGRMFIDAPGEANTLELGEGQVEVGTATLAGPRTISSGYNYIRNGGDPTSITLPVFLETSGDGYFGNAWVDDRRWWHDYIPGACGIAPVSGVIEYRTRTSAGNLGMPTTWGAPFVNPMATAPGDDSPPAIPLDWSISVHDGMEAV